MPLHQCSRPAQALSQSDSHAWLPLQAPTVQRTQQGGIHVRFTVVGCSSCHFLHMILISYEKKVADYTKDIMVFCYAVGKKMVCFCHSSQSYSNDEHSPEPRDVLRSSPSRSHRHSVGFVPTVYNGTLPPSE